VDVTLVKGRSNATDRFFIQPEYISEIQEITSLPSEALSMETVIQEIRDNQIILNTERQKVLTRVLARPQQAQFRKQVLNKFDNTCILTGERMNIVLEACHIIPVEHKGKDTFINGLCMRADIHVLFDSKHIRFQPNGIVEYSEAIQQSVSYYRLPQKVKMPNFVSKEALSWRYDYY
jgi:predicted restriction endonuclease